MKFISVLLLIALVFSAATGLAESTSKHASSFVQKLVPQLSGTGQTPAQDVPVPAPTAVQEPPPGPSASGSRLGAYTAEILDASLAKDGKGNDCIVVTFEWSHGDAMDKCFLWSFSYNAFQGGVPLSTSDIPVPIDTKLEFYGAGKALKTQIAYTLANTYAPVQIVLSEFMGDAGSKIEKTFDLAKLGGAVAPPPSAAMPGAGIIGVYKAEIKDAALMMDETGNDCIVVTFEWSHISKEDKNFLWSFSYDAFQNGAPLYQSYMTLPIETTYDYIKAGTVLQTQIAYALDNSVSPVKIVLSEYMGATTDTIEKTFDPARLARLAPMPSLTVDMSMFIGTVAIVKSGYMTAYYDSNSNSGAVFRVHHGERFLCLSETYNGWYEILFIDGSTGYVSGKDGAVVMESYYTDGVTMSDCADEAVFYVETVRKADVYSQPKSGGQTNRDGATFYLPARTEVIAFGQTYRQGRTWYAIYLAGHGNTGVPEIAWLQAEDCVVTSGDSYNNIIPGWWYD